MTGKLDRRAFLKSAGAAALAAGAGGALAADKPSATPNLVVVFPDQMRGQGLGAAGEDPVVTPNLDAFAKESLYLTQAVSNYPVCSPFRAMFMTGQYPHASGVKANCLSLTAPYGCELPKNARCWSDVLSDKGYSLGYIGKWHLDAPHEPYIDCKNNRGKYKWNEWCSPDRRHGFDFWYAYGTYDWHLNPMYWATDTPRMKPIFVNQWGPEHEADLAIKYIKNADEKYRQKGRPFALVVSMNPPHTPYSQVPARYKKAYQGKSDRELINRENVNIKGKSSGAKLALAQIRNYFSMITGVDEQFGRIVKALADAGLEKNTIVLFMSDHGNCLGCHDKPTKNNRYEESMRVPFMIRWPGKIPPRKDDLLMSSPDIYPTLLDLMGFSNAIPKDLQGTSRAELFRTGKGARPKSQLYFWIPVASPSGGRRGLRNHRYTLEINRQKNKPEQITLHDNVNDPFQLKNAAKKLPDVVAKMTAEMNARLKEINDPWLDGGVQKA